MMEAFPENSVIEIQLWEAHVINRSGQNARFFVTYSLDGALVSESNNGRIAYRFTRETWFSEIKLFLIRNRIPVTVHYVAADLDSFYSQTDLFEGAS